MLKKCWKNIFFEKSSLSRNCLESSFTWNSGFKWYKKNISDFVWGGAVKKIASQFYGSWILLFGHFTPAGRV